MEEKEEEEEGGFFQVFTTVQTHTRTHTNHS